MNKKLGELSNTRCNNLNVMRIIAAMLVIVCHSIPLCMGENYEDIVGGFTHGMLNLGGIAVGFFFVTGGYLIAGSAQRKERCVPFFKARIRRIFPSLIVVVLICAFIIGPIFTGLRLNEYFSNVDTYKYLLNIFFVPIHNLPGVFDNNIYPNVVNGPLWTLPIEFMCYIGCFCAYKLGFFEKRRFVYTIPFFVLSVCIIYLFFGKNVVLIRIIRPVLLYYVGIGFYLFRDKIIVDVRIAILLLFLFCGSVYLGYSFLAMFVIFPYMIFCFAYGYKGKLCNVGRKHEVSYGMYLWGWPIQQMICSQGGILTKWYINAMATIIVASLIGYVNSVVVEKHI